MNVFSFRRTAPALMLLAACASAPAWADTPSASSGITEFTWKLIDLNPTDGIAPSVSFGNTRYSTSVSYTGSDNSHDYQSSTQQGTLSLDFINGSTQTSALPNSTSVAAHLSTGANWSRAAASSTFSSDFRLTPWTGILFSAAGTSTAAHGANSSASASASLDGLVKGWDKDNGYSSFWDSVSATQGSQSYPLLGYMHSGVEALDGVVQLSSALELSSMSGPPSSPVPEPASVAMLVSGLAIVGARAARRR